MYAFVFDKRSLARVTVGLLLGSAVLFTGGFLIGQHYVERTLLPAETTSSSPVQALPIAAWSGLDPSISGDFTIQAGAYSDWQNAAARQRELGSFSPSIVQVEQGDASVLYVVRIGVYASRDQADQKMRQILQRRPADDSLQVRLLDGNTT